MRVKGEITAFLSLILLLMLALTGTLIESARVAVMRSDCERTLLRMEESLFTEYCLPLWEKYHVFFLEQAEMDQLEEEMKHFLTEEERNRLKKLEMTELVRATEEAGELYVSQIEEYMKFNISTTLFQQYEQNNEQVRQLAEASLKEEESLQKKEEEAAKAEEYLELIELVEGIQTSSSGLSLDNGKMKASKSFAKKICYGEVTAQRVGVTNSVVYGTMKDRYYDIKKELEDASKLVEQLKQTPEENTKETLVKRMEQMWEHCDTTREVTKEAIDKCKEINAESAEMPVLSGIGTIKSRLESNYKILEDVKEKSYLIQKVKENSVNYEEVGIELKNLQQKMASYEIASLQFEYADNLEEQKVASPLDTMKKVLENGVLELVLEDADKLSEKEIDEENVILIDSKKENDVEPVEHDYGQDILESKEGEYNSNITKSFGEFGNGFGVNMILSRYLLCEYAFRHFGNMQEILAENPDADETALDYELEYLIAGKCTDKENAASVMNRILGIRTIANYMYLLTDSAGMKEAYITAAALVGIIGVEPLVQLIQHMILIVWAYEESLVDAAALLKGEQIPVIKNKETFQIGYGEVCLFSKNLIQQKVENIKNNPVYRNGLRYKDYLRLFLLLLGKEKYVSRSMTLTEQNMRLWYRPEFNLSNCIYGIRAEADWEIPVHLRWAAGMVEVRDNTWRIHTEKSYCY